VHQQTANGNDGRQLVETREIPSSYPKLPFLWGT